mmetsp:Transcript_7523/g.15390  ORF Transcript_7523/g.15390 Transcript_7523/m.15390 type:complete len:1133 (-) Transcript_7523:134-3532(-)
MSGPADESVEIAHAEPTSTFLEDGSAPTKHMVATDGVIDDEGDVAPSPVFGSRKPDFLERESMRAARNPCIYFWISFVISLLLGVCGMVFGDFAVAVDNAGWNSRGTKIADRHTQFMLVNDFRFSLWGDNENDEVWTDLTTRVQDGWETDDDDRRRRLLAPMEPQSASFGDITTLGHRFQRAMQMDPMQSVREAAVMPPRLNQHQLRNLQLVNNTEGTLLEGCDTSFYTSEQLYDDSHLWPIWRTKKVEDSFFNSPLIQELCEEEEKTQKILQDKGQCMTCSDGKTCLQPYSIVFYARLTVTDGMKLSCSDLATAWTDEGHEADHATSSVFQQCVEDLNSFYNLDRDGMKLPDSCPEGFWPSLIDERYPDPNLYVQFSSSIFATYSDYSVIEDMYDDADSYARGSSEIKGAYDTQWEDFVELSLDNQLLIDMSLAVGSAFMTCIAMMLHTRSPFITVVGLAQIVISFPLAFFFYTFVAQLEFFPFLNFIGIFVLFALGADDVFVAVDKWKNARLKYPDATTEEVAAVAMPDAAEAMFLTTLTTSVAFFGTAVCPVAPIRCFAVFVGLMVVFDYMMCVLLVFPALAIWDRSDKANRCCCYWNCAACFKRCKCCGEKSPEESEMEQDEIGNSAHSARKSIASAKSYDTESTKHQDGLIHRILKRFFGCLQLLKWPLLLICGGSLVWCAIVASGIELPTSSDVRLYNENDNQYEQNFVWRKNLLYKALEAKGGSTAHVIWGVRPGDTGDLNNPDEWSQLLIDETFNPSTTEAQVYLRDFCDRFFSEDFAEVVDEGYLCPMNAFDEWLQKQSSNTTSTAYSTHCDGATSLPMSEDKLDLCMYNWGQEVREYRVLARQDKITTMYFSFNSRVRYDSPFEDLEDEWNLLEKWMKSQDAPEGADHAFFTSEDFWWYDTNGAMLDTAFQSAGIAMAAAAAVILFSSRSLILTIFATVTVGYVLTSVMAMLVAVGWTLGFLESILFAILIGISCDFVIHFAHAYTVLKGHASREERTLFALLSMGPSILAAAFTTFSAALIMLFTVITFFQKFAIVLFLTVIQSLAGSFIVFLTLTICLGPSDPTYLVDRMMQKCYGCCGKDYDIQAENTTEHGEVNDERRENKKVENEKTEGVAEGEDSL